MATMYLTLQCPKGCNGCLFLSHNCCDFIGMTGRARMLISKAGKDCKVKATTQKRKEEIMQIYGCSQHERQIESHRRGGRKRAQNIARKNSGRPKKFDEMEAWTIYENERLSDGMLGKRLGVSESTIARWRWRNGYPANRTSRNEVVDREPTEPPEQKATEGTNEQTL